MSRKTGEEMAKEFSRFINGADRDDKAQFVEYITKRDHRTLQQQAFGVFIDAIFEWAKAENFDLRNEYTVTTSKKVAELLEYPGAPLI